MILNVEVGHMTKMSVNCEFGIFFGLMALGIIIILVAMII